MCIVLPFQRLKEICFKDFKETTMTICIYTFKWDKLVFTNALV